MPKIAASLVVPVSGPVRRNAVLELDSEGYVKSLSRGNAPFKEMAGVEYYSGILIPGLADMMCGSGQSGHQLLGKGVRIAGITGSPGDRDGYYQEDDNTPPGEPKKATWQNRYGRTVGYRIFDNMNHFREYFRPSGIGGVYYHKDSGENRPVMASTGGQDIFERMLELQEEPWNLSFSQLIDMATINGALVMGYDEVAGTFSPGAKPGISIIEGADLNKLRLLPVSRLRRLY